MQPRDLLHHKLRVIRRRVLLRTILRLGLALFTGLAIGFAAFGVIPSLVSEGIRPALAAGLLVLGLASAVGFAFLSFRGATLTMSDLIAARTLSYDHEELRPKIESGADVSRWAPGTILDRGASAILVEAQVEEAGRSAAQINESRVPLPVDLRTWAIPAFGMLLVLTTLLITRPQGFRIGWASLQGATGHHSASIVRLKVTVLPPAYTGLPASETTGGAETKDAAGPVKGLRGSKVTLDADLLGKVTSGTLEPPSGGNVPADVLGDRFNVSWLLDKPGLYRLSFFRDDKPVPSDFPSQPVEIIEDALPEVLLEAPEGDIRVAKDTEVEVKFSAHDDFGLDKAEVVLSGKREIRIPVSLQPGKTSDASVRFLPLAYENLGDGAHLYVEVFDNDTVSGPKRAVSRSVYLSFVDRKGLLADIEGLEQRLFEALLMHLADHLETPGDDASSLTRLRTSAQDLLTLFRELINRIQTDPESNLSPSSVALLAMQTGLEGVIRPFADGGWDRSRIVPELERDILLLDRLLKNLRMENVLNMGEEVAALQQSLFEKLEAGESPQSLMPLLQQLMAKMNQMMRRLSEGANQMPEEFANADAMKDMPASELEQALKDLKKALASGDRDAARKAAESLLKTMSEWMQALEAAASDAAKSSMGMSLAGLDELDKDIKDLIAGEEKVLEDTRNITEAAGRPKLDFSTPSGQGLLQQIEEKLNRISNDVRNMEMQSAGQHGQKPPEQQRLHGGQMLPGMSDTEKSVEYFEKRNRLNSALQEIRSRLRNDPNSARDTVPALQKSFEDVAQDLASLDSNPASPRSEALRQGRKQGESDIEGLKSDLEKLMGSKDGSSPSMSPGAAEKLSQLSGEQGRLGGKTAAVRDKLKNMLRNLPFLPGNLPDTAEQVRGNMNDASGKLKDQKPGGAIPPETSALEGLSEMAGAFQKAKKQLQSGMGQSGGFRMTGMPGSHGSNGQDVDRSRVDIPKEQQAAEIRGFREDILKAMRSGRYPKDYKAEVEAYYEKLIQ